MCTSRRQPRLTIECFATLLPYLWLTAGATAGPISPYAIQPDTFPDAVMRLTNPDPGGVFDPALHRLPDLRVVTLGTWQPVDPATDLFAGAWDSQGLFFRLDLEFDGLLNPPGPAGFGVPADPFAYGPNPVFGFFELNVDGNVDTGGELPPSTVYRYLGNVGRFGGRISVPPMLAARMATQAGDFDGVFVTPPFIERSGEEFHLALFGEELSQIEVRAGNADLLFERGEVWVLHGMFLHRAHGYEPFGLAGSPQGIGIYKPQVMVLFEHDAGAGTTRISLVYPLTNAGSAAQLGVPGPPEANDGNALNQNSVEEALADLQFSAMHAPPASQADPAFALISAWAGQTPANYLVPRNWSDNMLAGSRYVDPNLGEGVFVWTDVFPDAVGGDFNGDGIVSAADAQLLDEFISANDGVLGLDVDGMVNDVVSLPDFAANFCLFDTNYDGLVAPADQWPPVPSDANGDGQVDLADHALLVNCLSGPIAPPAPLPSVCEAFDTDYDHDVDLRNVAVFQRILGSAP